MIAALPDALPNDVDVLRALIVAERTEKRLLIEERDELNAANEKLHHLIAVLRQARFGRKSERLSEDRLTLVLEELETANAKTEAEDEKKDESLKGARAKKRRANKGALPAHLQRMLACLALVAPRIIAAIAGGTAPADLAVTGLAKALPYSWAEQEKKIGLAGQVSANTFGPRLPNGIEPAIAAAQPAGMPPAYWLPALFEVMDKVFARGAPKEWFAVARTSRPETPDGAMVQSW